MVANTVHVLSSLMILWRLWSLLDLLDASPVKVPLKSLAEQVDQLWSLLVATLSRCSVPPVASVVLLFRSPRTKDKGSRTDRLALAAGAGADSGPKVAAAT